MNEALRKLNEEGMRQFSDWLRDGAAGATPLELLSSPESSAPLKATIIVPRNAFADRFEFGVYLNEVLGSLARSAISGDRGLWSALALRWFDLLCPPRGTGSRKLREEYYYILSSDYRHYYRHLVRSPWQLVHNHGENARFLLTSPKEQSSPLSVHGELLEQFGGRQQVLASKPIIAEASRLYLDPSTGRPRKGAAGSGAGSARRFAFVLRQLDLTYDPACMENGALLAVLPKEFDRWKADDAAGAAAPASASRRARDR